MKKAPQVSVGLRLPLRLVNAPSRNRAAGGMHKRPLLQAARRQNASIASATAKATRETWASRRNAKRVATVGGDQLQEGVSGKRPHLLLSSTEGQVQAVVNRLLASDSAAGCFTSPPCFEMGRWA